VKTMSDFIRLSSGTIRVHWEAAQAVSLHRLHSEWNVLVVNI
jgi:hypothetical protein